MQELTTSASLVDYEALADGSSITAVLSRSELEAALHADDSAGVWLELGHADEGDSALLTIELADADIERILGGSSGDAVVLALDGDALESLFDDPDVEAHGLRGALAIAVTAGAIAAPTSLAAVPQAVASSATAQHARTAATAQQASAAATAQVSSAASRAQVARSQDAKAATKAQVSRAATKAQVSKRLVVRASGVNLLRAKRG